MGLLADYHLAHEHLPLVGVASEVPRVTLRVDIGQPNHAGLPRFFVRADGRRFTALEGAFERSAFVADYTAVGETDGERTYQVIPAASMDEQLGPHVDDLDELRALADNESVVRAITVTPEGWRQRRWFADRDAFDAYCSFWRRNADLSLDRLVETGGEAPSGGELSDPQREALLAAYRMGYFDVPRSASLSEVAEELGISAPALSERLRRASARLVEALVAEADLNGLTV